MEFLKYPHVERYGTPEVAGIDVGECWVFPKLDGTNASAWFDGRIRAGSRTRELSGERDNHGFFEWITGDSYEASCICHFLAAHPHLRLFGEWLVPHTFKQYRPGAWRHFYVFDVYDESTGHFLHWEKYASLLQRHDITHVEPVARISNPTEADLRRMVDANTYLVQDGAGPGEGIVLKRYDFTSHYGRTTWAKIVRNEFKEENRRAFGVQEPGGSFQVELAIAEEFITQALVEKERAKVEHALLQDAGQITLGPNPNAAGWLYANRGKLIPRLLETVFHCLVTEELWAALKKHHSPTINFRRLRLFCQAETKKYARDLF